MHPYNKTKRFTSSLWHWVANTLGVVTYRDESLQVSLSGTGTLSILCPREFAQCCSAAGTQCTAGYQEVSQHTAGYQEVSLQKTTNPLTPGNITTGQKQESQAQVRSGSHFSACCSSQQVAYSESSFGLGKGGQYQQTFLTFLHFTQSF